MGPRRRLARGTLAFVVSVLVTMFLLSLVLAILVVVGLVAIAPGLDIDAPAD